jgi:ABC-2 type transport system permease protein
MAYAAHRLDLTVTTPQVIGFLLLTICSLLVHYSLMLMLAATSFWTVRGQGIVWGYYNLFNIARMPDAAFRGFFKVFFTYALPVLLVANVPAKLLADKLRTPGEMLLLWGLSVVCFGASEWVWRHSLRRYTSASS